MRTYSGEQRGLQLYLWNRFPGVQIPRNICTRLARYFYSTNVQLDNKTILLQLSNCLNYRQTSSNGNLSTTNTFCSRGLSRRQRQLKRVSTTKNPSSTGSSSATTYKRCIQNPVFLSVPFVVWLCFNCSYLESDHGIQAIDRRVPSLESKSPQFFHNTLMFINRAQLIAFLMDTKFAE